MSQTIQVIIAAKTEEGFAAVRNKIEKEGTPVKDFFRTEASGASALLHRLSKEAAADYILVLNEYMQAFPENFLKKMLASFSDEKTALVYAVPEMNSGKLCGSFLVEMLHKEKEVYTVHDLYENGISTFTFPLTFCMYRVSLLKHAVIPVSCISDAGFSVAASLLYTGYRARVLKDCPVQVQLDVKRSALRKAAFDLGVYQKTAMQTFGLGTNVTKTKTTVELDGKKVMNAPIVKKNMENVYMEAKNRMEVKNPFARLSLSFLVCALRVNDWTGQHYHRLPGFVSRVSTGNSWFFE